VRRAGCGAIRTGHENPQKTAISAEGGAESGAVGAAEAPVDAELAAVVEAWPDLPGAARARILAIIETAGGGQDWAAEILRPEGEEETAVC